MGEKSKFMKQYEEIESKVNELPEIKKLKTTKKILFFVSAIFAIASIIGLIYAAKQLYGIFNTPYSDEVNDVEIGMNVYSNIVIFGIMVPSIVITAVGFINRMVNRKFINLWKEKYNFFEKEFEFNKKEEIDNSGVSQENSRLHELEEKYELKEENEKLLKASNKYLLICLLSIILVICTFLTSFIPYIKILGVNQSMFDVLKYSSESGHDPMQIGIINEGLKFIFGKENLYDKYFKIYPYVCLLLYFLVIFSITESLFWISKEFINRKRRIEEKEGVTKTHKLMTTRALPGLFVYSLIYAFLVLSLYLPIKGDEVDGLLEFYHIVPFIPIVCSILVAVCYIYLRFNTNSYFKAMKKYCGYK